MFRKILSIFLALLLCLSLFAALVSCGGEETPEGPEEDPDEGFDPDALNPDKYVSDSGSFPDSSVTWTYYESGRLVIGGTGDMGDCIYKANGESDTDQPFGRHLKYIYKIEIAEGVTSLSENTFKLCTNIKEIKIPSTITEIPFACFEGCTKLETVEAPSVTTIGENAFAGCSSLESITLSETLQEVDLGAFFTGNDALSVTYYGTEAAWQALLAGGVHKTGNDVLKNATVSYDTQD